MRVVGSLMMLFVATALVLAGGSTPRREDIPKYLQMLTKSAIAKDRALAAEMIGRRGSVSRKDVVDAIEPLKLALAKDGDAKVRAASARALGAIAADADKIVPLLIEALADKSDDVKFSTITALSQYGGRARPATKALAKIANNKDEKKMSMAARNAMKSINAKEK